MIMGGGEYPDRSPLKYALVANSIRLPRALCTCACNLHFDLIYMLFTNNHIKDLGRPSFLHVFDTRVFLYGSASE